MNIKSRCCVLYCQMNVRYCYWGQHWPKTPSRFLNWRSFLLCVRLSNHYTSPPTQLLYNPVAFWMSFWYLMVGLWTGLLFSFTVYRFLFKALFPVILLEVVCMQINRAYTTICTDSPPLLQSVTKRSIWHDPDTWLTGNIWWWCHPAGFQTAVASPLDWSRCNQNPQGEKSCSHHPPWPDWSDACT